MKLFKRLFQKPGVCMICGKPRWRWQRDWFQYQFHFKCGLKCAVIDWEKFEELILIRIGETFTGPDGTVYHPPFPSGKGPWSCPKCHHGYWHQDDARDCGC